MPNSIINNMLFCLIFYLIACQINISISVVFASSSNIAGAAIITRRLAFPDFKDDEKAGAITLLGSAAIDKSSGMINIPAFHPNGSKAPADLANTAGRALYSFPFRMLDPATNSASSFHTTFSFRMRKVPQGGRGSDGNSTSDSGLTFLVVPDELTVGRNGGWMGMMNDACDETYRPFAVEFDTFKNEEFQDPNDHHVGINYGSIISSHTADITSTGVSLRDESPARAWISYDSDKHVIDVRLAKDGHKKPARPLISVPLDLSEIFKEYMFVGFSGGTSGGSKALQVHSILSWHFSSDSTGILRYPKEETCVKRLLPALNRPRRSEAPSAFIILCLVILILVLAVITRACVPWKKRGDVEVSTALKLMRSAIKEKPRALHKPRKFSLSEVLQTTRLFNEGNMLGYGKNGIFYKGLLADSSQVAIKRHSSSFLQQVSSLHTRKINKEIRKLSRLHHPNLVPLKGWCLDKGEILLVYEYMANGSLDQWLFSQGSSIFPWIRRYKIVKEIAGALAFMHSSFEKPVVHKNVKLSNVLLDITFRAKLGDFGVSKKVRCVNQGGSNTKHAEVMSNGAGNPSKTALMRCLPPDQRQTNEVKITQEMDVYWFGVMLLEIVCGKMETSEDGEEEDLVEWVWSLQQQGKLVEAIDEDLSVGSSRYYTWVEEAASVLTIGLLCTLEDPSERPSMTMVAKYLHGECPFPKVPSRKKLCGLPYPDHSPDYPSCNAFNVCTPLELYCLSNNSDVILLHQQEQEGQGLNLNKK